MAIMGFIPHPMPCVIPVAPGSAVPRAEKASAHHRSTSAHRSPFMAGTTARTIMARPTGMAACGIDLTRQASMRTGDPCPAKDLDKSRAITDPLPMGTDGATEAKGAEAGLGEPMAVVRRLRQPAAPVEVLVSPHKVGADEAEVPCTLAAGAGGDGGRRFGCDHQIISGPQVVLFR